MASLALSFVLFLQNDQINACPSQNNQICAKVLQQRESVHLDLAGGGGGGGGGGVCVCVCDFVFVFFCVCLCFCVCVFVFLCVCVCVFMFCVCAQKEFFCSD